MWRLMGDHNSKRWHLRPMQEAPSWGSEGSAVGEQRPRPWGPRQRLEQGTQEQFRGMGRQKEGRPHSLALRHAQGCSHRPE